MSNLIFVVDCGKNASTIYNAQDDETKVISHQDVLLLAETLPEGSLLICEQAHLGVPRETSKAQPFYSNQLKRLYSNLEEKGITLKLFPQQSTTRAKNHSRLEKSDLNDPKSIYLFWKNHPEISMMNPNPDFTPSMSREFSWNFKKETDNICNAARVCDYKDENDSVSNFILNNIDELSKIWSEDAKSAFGISRYKPAKYNNQINLNKIKMTQLYSIACVLLDSDGNLRQTDKGILPTKRWAKKFIFRMSPFHLKGGIVRSNIYYHGLRHWVSTQVATKIGIKAKKIKTKRRNGYWSKEDKQWTEPFSETEDSLYREYRSKYCRAVLEVFDSFRNKLILETI